MNELQFGTKLRKALNEAAHVDASVAERLRAARARALEHQKHEPLQVSGLTRSGDVVGRLGGPSEFSLRVLVPITVLVCGLAVIWGWQQGVRIAEVEEIDVQLLTDELPPEAYLDKGFEAWLKKRSSF